MKILKKFETREKAESFKELVKEFLAERQETFDKFYKEI